MRTSTLTGSVSPTGVNSRSCITRSSRTCVSGLMSPISSRNIDPVSADSNRPFLAATAPVNAPFVCPNSSDSSSSEGILEQLTTTKGFWARGLASWIALATSSFPVPLSPVIRTVERAGATCSTRRNTFSIFSDRPINPSRLTERAIACRSVRRSSSLRRLRMPLATRASSCSFWNGLRMTPAAPFSHAEIAVSKVAYAVTIRTTASGSILVNSSRAVRPPIPGIETSISTTSKLFCLYDSIASSPVFASSTL